MSPRVAHEYLGLERGPDLDVHVEDARPFLKRGSDAFDVIEVDVFAGGPYAPFYCLTAEFFEAARARLAPTGLLSMNVYAPGGDRKLAEAVVATLATVFPTVLEVPLAEESVLIALRESAPLETSARGWAARSCGASSRPLLVSLQRPSGSPRRGGDSSSPTTTLRSSP